MRKSGVGGTVVTVGLGLVAAWGLWQVAQSEAEDPGSTARRTGSATRTIDQNVDQGKEAGIKLGNDIGDVGGEIGGALPDGAGRRAPQAADQ